MKLYLLQKTVISDYELENSTLGVYLDQEKARKILKDEWKEALSWFGTEEGDVVEESENSCEVYPEGYAGKDYLSIKIEEIDLTDSVPLFHVIYTESDCDNTNFDIRGSYTDIEEAKKALLDAIREHFNDSLDDEEIEALIKDNLSEDGMRFELADDPLDEPLRFYIEKGELNKAIE